MALPVEKRQLMLGGALLLTLAVSAWLGLGMDQAEDGAEIVELAKPVSANRNAASRRAAPELSLPVLAEVRATAGSEQQGESKQQAADVFEPHSWFVAPPPSRPVQAAVVLPAPPPLPFTYLGTVQDGGHTVVFLAKEQRLYTVRKGEVIDGQYRLEDESRGRIVLVYLPLNTRQTLVIKGAS